MFSYHVAISMAADCQFPKAVLRTRHWEIHDGPNVDQVDGPGVIGFYPEVSPPELYEIDIACTLTPFA